jgi:aspartate aminotransferase
LGVGAYRDNDGKPYKLESVKRAEKIVFEKDLDHEYLPVQGNENFV